jgi:hypothetical protein
MCDKTHPFYQRPYEKALPEEWVTLAVSMHDDQHFCSRDCLVKWVGTSEQADKPECKARRFVMSDGTEGVKWKDGCVDLDTNSPHCLLQSDSRHCNGIFYSWNEFINHHFNCEITWIDEERKA